MAELTAQQLQQRLAFDYEIVTRMQNRIVNIEAYQSAAALKSRRGAIASLADAGRASHYRVEYHIRSLVRAGVYHSEFVVSCDLLAGGNYPFSQPICQVISKPIPWTPHFSQGVPICTGELWGDMRGHATLGHLVLHLAKLLNLDEPGREEEYGGYQPAAAHFWRTKLKQQPITPGLAYPVLPLELTHAECRSTGGLFKQVTAPRGDEFVFQAATRTMFQGTNLRK